MRDVPFATSEEAVAYLSGERIQCLFCGRWYKALVTHITAIHGISADEYKARFNLPLSRGLLCASSRELRSTQMREMERRFGWGDILVETEATRRDAGIAKPRPRKSRFKSRVSAANGRQNREVSARPCPVCGSVMLYRNATRFTCSRQCWNTFRRQQGIPAPKKPWRIGTHCIRGHEYTPENTGQNKCGRVCKTCKREIESARVVRRRLARRDARIDALTSRA
jgi:hypothetical protein